jgi:hypothetical protein
MRRIVLAIPESRQAEDRVTVGAGGDLRQSESQAV